ncbi:hypothetical protein [Halodesulfovibrio aestuarii]|uniref:HNH endonuclease n=1 Tax=Halodesulfovibrio aestuarii TaxID=126333 RepID=A0ABV4JWF6_9BACT
MKYFKPAISETKFYPISREQFEILTKRTAPHVQTKGGRNMQFAVCPSCNNPIQLIGLYKPLPDKKRPYGKHYHKSIPDLADFKKENYETCFLACKKTNLSKNNKRKTFTDQERQILNLLINYFDQVAYLFQKQTGIWLSVALAKHMLQAYKAEQGHLYLGATPLNVPWIFAYMANNSTLWGRRILDEELRRKIVLAAPNIFFEDNFQLKSKGRTDISFWFTKHRSRIDAEGELSEYMELKISESSQDIITQKIYFDHAHFQSLLTMPDSLRYRKNELVPVAQEILGSLL